MKKGKKYRTAIFIIGEMMFFVVTLLLFIWLWYFIGITAEDFYTGRFWWIFFCVVGLILLNEFKEKFRDRWWG